MKQPPRWAKLVIAISLTVIAGFVVAAIIVNTVGATPSNRSVTHDWKNVP